MLLEVLEVEQFERDAGLLPFGVEVGAVGHRPPPPAGGRRPVEAGFEGLVGKGLDLGPVQPGMGGTPENPGHRADADGQAGGHLSMATGQAPLLAEDLTDFAHGQSLGRHPAPFLSGWRAGPSSVAVRLGTRSVSRGSPIRRGLARCSR